MLITPTTDTAAIGPLMRFPGLIIIEITFGRTGTIVTAGLAGIIETAIIEKAAPPFPIGTESGAKPSRVNQALEIRLFTATATR